MDTNTKEKGPVWTFLADIKTAEREIAEVAGKVQGSVDGLVRRWYSWVAMDEALRPMVLAYTSKARQMYTSRQDLLKEVAMPISMRPGMEFNSEMRRLMAPGGVIELLQRSQATVVPAESDAPAYAGNEADMAKCLTAIILNDLNDITGWLYLQAKVVQRNLVKLHRAASFMEAGDQDVAYPALAAAIDKFWTLQTVPDFTIPDITTPEIARAEWEMMRPGIEMGGKPLDVVRVVEGMMIAKHQARRDGYGNFMGKTGAKVHTLLAGAGKNLPPGGIEFEAKLCETCKKVAICEKRRTYLAWAAAHPIEVIAVRESVYKIDKEGGISLPMTKDGVEALRNIIATVSELARKAGAR